MCLMCSLLIQAIWVDYKQTHLKVYFPSTVSPQVDETWFAWELVIGPNLYRKMVFWGRIETWFCSGVQTRTCYGKS